MNILRADLTSTLMAKSLLISVSKMGLIKILQEKISLKQKAKTKNSEE